MKRFEYQENAVEELSKKVVKLLNQGGYRHKVVFKAPTGSGKTVMTCQTLANIVDTLHSDPTNKYEDVAFIWFAPRKLHLQSYNKLKYAFADGRELKPVMFDDLEQSEGIQPGEILFVNWESVNREDNLMVRDSESSASLYEICRKTQENGLPIIAVIDEEHMFWSKTADKSKAVLDKINPAIEIRVSATPKTVSYDVVNVSRQDVIDAEMIKKEVVLNSNIDEGLEDITLENHLLKTALKKREEIAEAYKAQGVDIKPLLLIQLPNDKKESMTVEDEEVAKRVKQYLETISNITTENGKLAVWLANEKENLDGLENNDNLVQVLLFKEAIALGWDCPRAAVLVIFRKLQSDEFTIQTVGRILRMPEQKHYNDEVLNIGWVYTDLAKEKINIVTADADYIKKNPIEAHRRENLNNIVLSSVYVDQPNALRNYMGPDFKRFLYKEAEKFWEIDSQQVNLFSYSDLVNGDEGEETSPKVEEEAVYYGNNRKKASGLRFDVKTINIPIPKDIHFQNEVQTLDVSDQSVKFARTVSEIDRVFLNFLSGYVGKFEKRPEAVGRLSSSLLEMMADYFGLFDTDAKKVILYHDNQKKFDRLIKQTIENYLKAKDIKRQQAAKRSLKEFEWTVPESRTYDEETHRIEEAKNHALKPFVELNSASKPEKDFAEFLEQNSKYIDWWYKNGDKGKEHYAVEYEISDGTKHPFYVDFVIRLKNGKIMLFDTKTAGSEPLTAHIKHNALNDYINKENAKGKNLVGGVIVKNGMNWVWSRYTIENTVDHTGWDYLDFKRENA